MTMTSPTGGSPTLEALFKNCVTEEQIQTASNSMRGPFKVGDVTGYVFRPVTGGNNRGVMLTALDDTGLAGCSEGGRMEVDMNQLGPEELGQRAQDWFQTNVRRGFVSLRDTVAIVFDNSNMVAEELNSVAAQEQLKDTLERLSRPSVMEKVTARVKAAWHSSPN